ANDAILKNMQANMTSLTNLNHERKNMFGQFMKMNTASSFGLGTLPVERETKATKDMVHPTNNGSTKDVQPSVTLLTNKDKLFKLARTSLNEHCSAVLLKKFPEKLEDPGKFLIPCNFPRMAECLALADLGPSINLMPLSVWNKLSLLDLSPTKAECLALADLGASINLIPLFVFPNLSPTCMTLELIDRSISRPIGVAEDVYVKVGELTLHISKEAITFNLDLTSRYSANYNDMATKRIDVSDMRCEEYSQEVLSFYDVIASELTLHISKEAITFNLDLTSRYSANYNDMATKRIDVSDMRCEEYSQEVLSFYDVIASGNPTPYYDPIVSTTSPTLTPFENSDFFLEEVDAFLAIEDDP
nr:reverse transcriptase domain-containing protein [Tanacetum cinerariifolium]